MWPLQECSWLYADVSHTTAIYKASDILKTKMSSASEPSIYSIVGHDSNKSLYDSYREAMPRTVLSIVSLTYSNLCGVAFKYLYYNLQYRNGFE